ncbi:MAG: hypothetical protein LBT33_10765, partial [Spirochaetia bacterium]|nr:hypothetical protein [Spirochaetia bacterium]
TVNKLRHRSARGAQRAGRNFAKQNCCSPMQPGLQRKSFLPPGGKKIEAESLVFGAGAPKMRTYFLNLLTLVSPV